MVLLKGDTQANLTAAEVNALWTNYLADSMVSIIFKQFMNTCDDKEVLDILDYASHLSNQHLRFIEKLFKTEEIAIPVAFGDSDFNKDSQRLFTDQFYLCYIKDMSKTGLSTYGAFLSGSSRPDIRKYATECLTTTSKLFNRATDLLLERGVEVRCPITPYPTMNEWISDTHFLAGWWGEQRTLTNAEVSDLFVNLLAKNNIKTLLTGFGQVAQSPDVKKYIQKGQKLAQKHEEIFSGYLTKSYLQSPVTWDSGVTTSTTHTFSDRLIMTQLGLLLQASIANYGISLSLCQRRDLSLNYVKMTSELATFAVDGEKILINNGWMEQPPMAVDRKELME